MLKAARWYDHRIMLKDMWKGRDILYSKINIQTPIKNNQYPVQCKPGT
jgi:hypothetical protein